jgi:hypothetical protein
VRRTHRSSGDLMSQRMELSWRSKVGVWRKQLVRPHVSLSESEGEGYLNVVCIGPVWSPLHSFRTCRCSGERLTVQNIQIWSKIWISLTFIGNNFRCGEYLTIGKKK